jgi:predicted nucleotidyltransferase
MAEKEPEQMFAVARNAILAALPDVLAIYVYGSFASGDERPQSDLDLAVLLPAESGIPDLLDLIGELAMRVGREVDLIDLRRVGDIVRREVLLHGKPIYVSEPVRVLSWEASAMSRYARHREEIRDILEEFERTGIGYGP